MPEHKAPFVRMLKLGDRGEDVRAVQRAMFRLGHLSQVPAAPVYWPSVKKAVQKFQRRNNLESDGGYGPQTHKSVVNAEGFDPYGEWLLGRAKKKLPTHPSPSSVAGTRAEMIRLAHYTNQRAGQIGYSQARPTSCVKYDWDETVVNEKKIWMDCSSGVIWLYQQAGAPSPAPEGYSGYGNTWSLRTKGQRIPVSSCLPGDLIHYNGHVTMAIGGGMCWSHGSEGGPYIANIYYRRDIYGASRYL